MLPRTCMRTASKRQERKCSNTRIFILESVGIKLLWFWIQIGVTACCLSKADDRMALAQLFFPNKFMILILYGHQSILAQLPTLNKCGRMNAESFCYSL